MMQRTNPIPLAGFLIALAACGGEAEPTPAPAPDSPPEPPAELSVQVQPTRGTHDTDVTVRASGLPPGARAGIGLGPPQSEYEIVTHATADESGNVVATVNVPNWAEVGRDYLWAVRAPGGADAVSERFRVTAGTDAEPVQVTGTLTEDGVECQALQGEDGTLYTLTGDLGGFGPGDRVEVEGTVAEMSICMQGTTLAVEVIREAG